MNSKQLTLLLVLAVVVGGAGWYVYSKKQSSYERGAEANTLLKGVPANAINDVAQITIKQGSNEVNLARGAEGWSVKERGNYPANFETISEVLKKFWDIKVTRQVEVGPSRLPVLKLTPTTGTAVDLRDDKGKSITTLLLGLPVTKESGGESPFGGGAFPSGRYVMRGDLKATSVAVVGDPFSNVEPKPEDWLNKNWFKVEKAKSVAVVSKEATNSWKLTRETETGEWKLADAKTGEAADSGKTSGLNWLLSSPSFNDVLVNAKNTNDATTATIETFDGFTYTLKIAKAEGENYAMNVSVAGNFPKERTPGKDEKKEDKEKLDKEFTDKRKQLDEKLKNEKAFEKWTYLAPTYTVDALLKPRKDFLAENKEEPKPEEKKSEAKPATP